MKKTDYKDILLNNEDIEMFNNLATKMGLVGEDNASEVILSSNKDTVKIKTHNSNCLLYTSDAADKA